MKAKLERAHFFKVQSGKITVWSYFNASEERSTKFKCEADIKRIELLWIHITILFLNIKIQSQILLIYDDILNYWKRKKSSLDFFFIRKASGYFDEPLWETLNGQSPPQDECLERYRNRWTSGFSSTHWVDIISEIIFYIFFLHSFFWKIFIDLLCKKAMV